jgi:cytochrome c oxidase assembly protein subunit 15
MLIQLALTGLMVALLPLAVVLTSNDTHKYRKLIWITLFLTFDLIMFGAFTRLTDSGLGCPDWPGCYGQANPVQAHTDIIAAEALMPTGPVTVGKAWIEMIHRYLAMSVGVLIIAIMFVAWRKWLKSGRQLVAYAPTLPTALFLFVCLQGAFGAWTVTLKLQPIIVTIHLVLGLAMLGMLTVLASRHSAHPPIASSARSLIVPASIALSLLLIQIILGGWVSTNYAVLACTDFPLCHGMFFPPMDFEHGFSLWRELGKTSAGAILPVDALTAIHWVHRNVAFIVIAYVAWIAHKAYKLEGLRKTGKWILIAIAAQFASGVSTIYLSWPIVIAILHNGGAALLLLLLVRLLYQARLAATEHP